MAIPDIPAPASEGINLDCEFISEEIVMLEIFKAIYVANPPSGARTLNDVLKDVEFVTDYILSGKIQMD